MQNLQRLNDEFNLTDAAAPQFNIALQFSSAHDFIFYPVLDRGDFLQNVLADGTRKTKRLDHFNEFRRQTSITGNMPRT